MTHIKDTKDIRINVFGMEGHAFFIRPPQGGPQRTVYGREQFHAELDKEIDAMIAQRHGKTPAPLKRCPSCNSSLFKIEEGGEKVIIKCWKTNGCNTVIKEVPSW